MQKQFLVVYCKLLNEYVSSKCHSYVNHTNLDDGFCMLKGHFLVESSYNIHIIICSTNRIFMCTLTHNRHFTAIEKCLAEHYPGI